MQKCVWLWLLGTAVAIVGIYFATRPDSLAPTPIPAVAQPGPAAAPPAPVAASSPSAVPTPAGTPPAATVPPVGIQDRKTIDFSSGQPVVRDSTADQAAMDAALKEMNEAAKDVTFKPEAEKK